MGMFPWDDAFYNIKGKSKELNDLYNTYLKTRDDLNLKGDTFRKSYADAQILSINVKAMLINLALATMTDDDYHKMLDETRVAKLAPVKQTIVAQVFSGIAEFSLTLDVGQAIFGFGKIGINSLRAWRASLNTTEAAEVEECIGAEAVEASTDIGITEAGEATIDDIATAAAEAGTEAGTEAGIIAVDEAVETATLCATEGATSGIAAAGEVALGVGPGIAIALGIDMIIGAVEGKKEEKEIADEAAKLNKALTSLKTFVDDLDTKIKTANTYIVDSMTQMSNVLNMLDKIMPAGFKYNFPSDLEHIEDWKGAFQSAAQQYFILSTTRIGLDDRIANHNTDYPGVAITKDKFSGWLEDIASSRNPSLTLAQATTLINYVVNASPELKKYLS